MEKFHSELYTKCLEDRTQELAKNDLVSIFLERGPSHSSFTTNGFFPLDHSVFCQILSAAVTWVLIIVQFGMRDSCGAKQSIST
ncbi:unnamed protein product [Nezara viridula]|uniref:Uncharacterized protein n=1 Tax=Nezara viridula TaxID=85310 RepID=A0A9P0HFX0_NEZVI|nr:unnamed protein product [Nezara viridula]